MADRRKVWLILSVALALVSVGVLVVSLYSPARGAVFGKALATIQKTGTEPTFAVLAATQISACGPTNVAGTTYQLTQDILTSSSCFTEFADNVVLDCKGYAIRGERDPVRGVPRSGIAVFGKSGVTTKNCVVSGFREGFYLKDVSKVILQDNNISGNSVGIYESTNSSAQITRNRACKNTNTDFLCDPYGSASASGTGNTFTTVSACTDTSPGWPQATDYALCPEYACADSYDNDADSLIDCSDPDCAGELSSTGRACCQSSTNCGGDTCSAPTYMCPVERCTDLIDNDGDKNPDCLDTDCAGNPSCKVLKSCTSTTAAADCPSAQCADTALAPGKAFSGICMLESYCLVADASVIPELCDGKDNDCDGQVDEGLSNNCVINAPPGDADSDGVADTTDNCPNAANADQADSDSDGVGNACDTETCDGVDNDGDGVIDESRTFQLSESEAAACMTRENCGSFGNVCPENKDCALTGGVDYTCRSDIFPNLCTDGSNNDADSLTDCADTDCSAAPACVAMADADGDGIPDTADTLCTRTPPGKRMGPDGCMIGDFTHDDAVTSADLTLENLRAQWIALSGDLVRFNTFIQNVRANMVVPS